MCNRCKDLVLTSCSGQRNELISSSVIVYVYYVKCVACEYILYINTLYSNSNVVGVFIVNCRTVVSLTGSHLRHHWRHMRSCTRAHGFVCNLYFSDHDTLLQVITDCTMTFDEETAPKAIFHARRPCYAERYRRFSIIPRRKRNKKGY